MQYHLSGDASLRNPVNGFSGVDVVHQGPEELASIAKLEMSGKTSERESHSKRSAAAVDIAENDSEERARTMKQTVISNNPWKI